MTVLEVRQQIRDRKIDNFYIFTGEEGAVQSAYVKKLAEVGGYTVQRLDSVSELFGRKRGGSMIRARFCYVVMNDDAFVKYEKAWESLLEVIGNNMLILQFTTLDKRSKFYGHFKDIIVDFQYLPATILMKYVHRETELSAACGEKLIQMCGNDYGRLLTEMDKVKRYADAKQVTHDEAFQILCDSHSIYYPPEDRVFDFVDAVISGRISDAYELYDMCIRNNEPTLVMIKLLYMQIRKLLQVQGCKSADISNTTGLEDWEIRKVKKNCGVYSNRELVNAMRLIRDTEKGIKTGQIEEQMCIDYLLINILGSWE